MSYLIATERDKTRSHSPYPSVGYNNGNSNDFVYINDNGLITNGSKYNIHCDNSSPPNCHIGSAVSNPSQFIYVNGIPVVNDRDSLSCGDSLGVTSQNYVRVNY